jgi:hypothetical protein
VEAHALPVNVDCVAIDHAGPADDFGKDGAGLEQRDGRG